MNGTEDTFTEVLTAQLKSNAGLLKLVNDLKNGKKNLCDEIDRRRSSYLRLLGKHEGLKGKLEELQEAHDKQELKIDYCNDIIRGQDSKIERLHSKVEYEIGHKKKISAWRDNYYRRAAEHNAAKLKLMELIQAFRKNGSMEAETIFADYQDWLKKRRKKGATK